MLDYKENKASIQALSRIDASLEYPLWLTNDRIFGTTGSGDFHIFALGSSKFNLITSLRKIHSKPIRETAIFPGNPYIVASTGHDKTICLTDLNKGQILGRNNLYHTGSSIKCRQDYLLGVTREDNMILLYDTRVSLAFPTTTLPCPYPKCLYTHCFYGSNAILLGQADGAIRHLDLRFSKSILSEALDPYCEGIGMIDAEEKAFVTSGYGEYEFFSYLCLHSFFLAFLRIWYDRW